MATASQQEHRSTVPQQVDPHTIAAYSWLFVFLNFQQFKAFVFSFCVRIHIEEINHTVLLHMTEKMSYKHSEVLSAVLTNRACHTLAVYFLLNKKMKRLSKEYRVRGSCPKWFNNLNSYLLP